MKHETLIGKIIRTTGADLEKSDREISSETGLITLFYCMFGEL